MFDWDYSKLPEYSRAIILVTLERQMIICHDEVLQFLKKMSNI